MTTTNRKPTSVQEDASASGVTTRQSHLLAAAVARDTNGGHAPDSTRVSTYREILASVAVYFLLLLRDLLTFLTRGGISAMMFAMDQVLRILLLMVEVILGPTGSTILGYPCRLAVWLYQVLLWVAYTLVELLFYLPWQVLLVYVIVLAILIVWMPSPLLDLFAAVFKTLHSFIGVYKQLYRLLGGSDPAVADGKT